jgi:hypothetical protein
MQFLVPLGDFAVFVDPEQGVLYFFAVRGGFVNAYVNGEFVGFGGGLETENEGRGGYWVAEGDCARGVGCYAWRGIESVHFYKERSTMEQRVRRQEIATATATTAAVVHRRRRI